MTKDNMTLLQRGDLSYAPVDQLSAMVDGLFLPLLEGKSLSNAWPTVVAQDVVFQAQALKSTTQVFEGEQIYL